MTTAALPRHTMYPSVEHRRVVVTGGGSGIGAAIVEAFARQGSHVLFLDIAESDSRALERELGGLPGKPRYLPCDLTDVQAMRQTLDEIEKEMGAVQVLVN